MDIAKCQKLISTLLKKVVHCKTIHAMNLLNSYSLLYYNTLFLFSKSSDNAVIALRFKQYTKTYLPEIVEHELSQLFLSLDNKIIVCIKNRFGSTDEFENINDYIKQCYDYTMSLNKQQNKMVSR